LRDALARIEAERRAAPAAPRLAGSQPEPTQPPPAPPPR
jgi:hypothetical protein